MDQLCQNGYRVIVDVHLRCYVAAAETYVDDDEHHAMGVSVSFHSTQNASRFQLQIKNIFFGFKRKQQQKSPERTCRTFSLTFTTITPPDNGAKSKNNRRNVVTAVTSPLTLKQTECRANRWIYYANKRRGNENIPTR